MTLPSGGEAGEDAIDVLAADSDLRVNLGGVDLGGNEQATQQRVTQVTAARDAYRAALIAYAKTPSHRAKAAWREVLRARAAARSAPLRVKTPRLRRGGSDQAVKPRRTNRRRRRNRKEAS